MKVTRRDIILIIVLVYIAIVAIGGFLLIKPQLEKKSDLENEYDVVKSEETEKDGNIAQIPGLQKNIDDIRKSIDEVSANFFEFKESPELHIQTLLQAELGSLTKLNNLTIVSPEIAATSKTITNADPSAQADIDIPEDAQVIKSDPTQPVQVVATEVTITVEGTIDNLLRFSDQLQNLQKVIEFNSVYVESKDAEDASNVIYTGTFVLSFVSVF